MSAHVCIVFLDIVFFCWRSRCVPLQDRPVWTGAFSKMRKTIGRVSVFVSRPACDGRRFLLCLLRFSSFFTSRWPVWGPWGLILDSLRLLRGALGTILGHGKEEAGHEKGEWDRNMRQLRRRMRPTHVFPRFFAYPNGTMFFCKDQHEAPRGRHMRPTHVFPCLCFARPSGTLFCPRGHPMRPTHVFPIKMHKKGAPGGIPKVSGRHRSVFPGA